MKTPKITLREKKEQLGEAFNQGKAITLISFDGSERTFTKFDVAKMFSVDPDSFSLANVLKYGGYKIPGFENANYGFRENHSRDINPGFDLE